MMNRNCSVMNATLIKKHDGPVKVFPLLITFTYSYTDG